MRRIVVYGVTGSGKSTLAALIAERLGLPYHSIDDMTWEPGWVPVSGEAQRERIQALLAGDEWVIDSAYGTWLDLALGRAELIVCLDLPRWVSLSRLVRRTALRIVRHESICNGNRETWRGTLLSKDSLLVWHFKSFARKRRRMRGWLRDPSMPAMVLLRSPREVRRWAAALPAVTLHGDRVAGKPA